MRNAMKRMPYCEMENVRIHLYIASDARCVCIARNLNYFSIWFLQELLHRTEQEDQARDSYIRGLTSRSARGSNRHHTHTQGGSLQDLVEAVNNEHLFDSEFLLTGQSKRLLQHNSRHKKNHSSVSSRQREGGSLPSNVNVSTSYKEPFLNEFNKTAAHHKVHKNERTISGGSGSSCGGGGGTGPGLGSRQNSVGSGCRDDIIIVGDPKKNHTVIEIDDDDSDETKHLLAHDSLAQVGAQFQSFSIIFIICLVHGSNLCVVVTFVQLQGIAEPLGTEDAHAIELTAVKKMNYTRHQVDVSVAEPSRSNNNIDKTIQFPTLMNSNAHALVDTVPFNNYPTVTSSMENTFNLTAPQNIKLANYPHSVSN